jgi:hypothetical protein
MVMVVAQKYQDSLKKIQKNVKTSYDYFKPNYDRYHEFRKFVFVTSLSADDIAVLKELGKPQIECNILESYISRLRGEFSKQEPSIEVFSNYQQTVPQQTLEAVEGFIRQIECESRKNGVAYDIYTDLLTGGFSVGKVTTDFANEQSFNQEIGWSRAFDPTLCGFDPLAQKSNKSDGRYAFELFPKTKDEFKDEYPNIDISQIKFQRNTTSGFNWSYRNEREDILLICDYYEKKIKRTKIVKLASGDSLTFDKYNELLEQWNNDNHIEQPPAIVDQRFSNFEVICRYRLIEDQVIEYVETDFKYFPLVFFDGNSINNRTTSNSEAQQITRPYVYHAKGIQKIKNMAFQAAANELENMIMSKWKMPKEGIPPEFADAYRNGQIPNVILYNAFRNNDPNVPLPPPQEVARVPEPPLVMNMFQAADQATQAILGSYDASLGINNNQLSGVAIVEGATQSNAAAMPYVIGYMEGLNHVANIIIDLIPKYYLEQRTIAVVGKDGKRNYVGINNGQVDMKYPENSLGVRVEAGVNFQIQKSKNLEMMISVAQAMPGFAQFMQQDGLPILVRNMEIKGADQLEPLAEKFMQEQAQQAQQAQQMQQQQMQQQAMMQHMQMQKLQSDVQIAQHQVPLTIMKEQTNQAKMVQDAQRDQVNAQLKAAEIGQMAQSNDNERIKLVLDANLAHQDNLVQIDKHETEKARMAVDVAMNAVDMAHRHSTNIADIQHRHNLERDELGHKVASTMLGHIQHENSESAKTKMKEGE